MVYGVNAICIKNWFGAQLPNYQKIATKARRYEGTKAQKRDIRHNSNIQGVSFGFSPVRFQKSRVLFS
jgi:hypothetical protein